MNEAVKLENQKLNPFARKEVSEPRRSKILVVEDDITQESFWTAIVERADRKAELFWATSELEAEAKIMDAIQKGQEFDLVITDIFLSGPKTGIDLWNKFFKRMGRKIIVTSGISYQKFFQYFNKSDIRPIFLQKPLVPHDCIGAIYSSLQED
jgi:DNA-binding NtrC family response regulator